MDNNGSVIGTHYSSQDDSPELMKFLSGIIKIGEIRAKVAADKEGKDLTIRVELAEMLILIGKADDSLDYLESVYKADAENKTGLLPKVIYLLGKVNAANQRLADAMKSFEKAADMDKDGKCGVKPKADYDRAYIMLTQNNFKDAIALLMKIISDFPGDENAPNATFYLGIALYRTGDKEGALTTLATFVDKYPTHPFAEQAKAGVKQIESEIKK